MSLFVHQRDPDADPGVGVAFTSDALDLGDRQPADARAADFARLSDALGVPVAIAAQVHGADVLSVTAPPGSRGLVDLTAHRADALVTTQPGLAVAVRVADCVPVVIASADAAVVGAVHAGRPGLLAGVIGAAVDVMRTHSDAALTALVGPHVCGACYEVPAAMADEVGAALGLSPTTTSWGTPSVDLGAAALAQLRTAGVAASPVGECTLHGARLHSHRRGADAGRQVGLAWIADASR